MNIKRLNARIQRNGFREHSGEYFVDMDSDLILNLRKRGKAAILGLMGDNGMYTILGQEALYYCSLEGGEGEMPMNEFFSILNDYTIERGKNFGYEFIPIDENTSIWVLSEEFMLALWNTILYLPK